MSNSLYLVDQSSCSPNLLPGITDIFHLLYSFVSIPCCLNYTNKLLLSVHLTIFLVFSCFSYWLPRYICNNFELLCDVHIQYWGLSLWMPRFYLLLNSAAHLCFTYHYSCKSFLQLHLNSFQIFTDFYSSSVLFFYFNSGIIRFCSLAF